MNQYVTFLCHSNGMSEIQWSNNPSSNSDCSRVHSTISFLIYIYRITIYCNVKEKNEPTKFFARFKTNDNRPF
jgi:hypothetical protein